VNEDVDIKVEHVSKKYCKSLRRSMSYGLRDISRNTLGLSSRPGKLRGDEFWAVDDVSFDVMRGETLGLIGPNGSGKTTMLKMLNGIFWPDKGKITVNGRVGALIAVGAGFHPALTGKENVYVNAAILGMTKKEATERFDDIIEFAGIGDFIDTAVKYYSSGMFVRLGFATAIHCEPDILLVDEVLAVGDSGFRTKCFNKIGELRECGMTTIIVSHSMQLISTYTDRALLLKDGKAIEFATGSEAAIAYDHLFASAAEEGIEKICSGDETIRFFAVELSGTRLHPGDSFSISMQYESSSDYFDVIVDTKVVSDGVTYFQATNKAFHKTIDLLKGTHSLTIEIDNITISNATAIIVPGIWEGQTKKLLFWWRIPVHFENAYHSVGSNFLPVRYQID
jgi:lipopolysaccharide transport system ATP-binding protein